MKKGMLKDDLDNFEKDLLMETSVSELKAIEKKVFMNNTSRQNNNSVNNKKNYLSLVYAVFFTVMSWFFITTISHDYNGLTFDDLFFCSMFVGGAIYNWYEFFMKK